MSRQKSLTCVYETVKYKKIIRFHYLKFNGKETLFAVHGRCYMLLFGDVLNSKTGETMLTWSRLPSHARAKTWSGTPSISIFKKIAGNKCPALAVKFLAFSPTRNSIPRTVCLGPPGSFRVNSDPFLISIIRRLFIFFHFRKSLARMEGRICDF